MLSLLLFRAQAERVGSGCIVNGAGALDSITRPGQQMTDQASEASVQRAGWRRGCKMEGCVHLGVLWSCFKRSSRIGRR